MSKIISNMKLGKKLFGGFAIVLLILGALSALSYMNFSKLNEANKWDKHTYEVLMELQNVLGEMVNMETGQRGFALTGNEASLEPFNSGKENFQTHYDKVKEL